MSFSAFEAEVSKVNDILCAVNLLTWDSRTMMPPGGVEARGKQIASLVGLARDIATGEGMLRAIEAARQSDEPDPDGLRAQAVGEAARQIDILARIPAKLVAEAAELKTNAQAAWAKARAESDFAGFAPWLERTLELQRETAMAIGYVDHPYDALVSTYEPDMTWARLRPLYDALKAALGPLNEAARDLPPIRVDFLERSFPVEKQRAFAIGMARRMGYDLDRGRLDDTLHPFEISFTRADVRITGRFRETWLPGGLFAVWHEAGHGIYEQGVDPSFTRSIFATDLVNLYAVGGASFGMHESQSRLLENRLGRSRRFWQLHFGELRDVFPEQLGDVSAGELWRAVNAPRPSLIRVEAGELTYDFHIILRSEIEAGLIAGEIRVADLPALWADKMESYLGLAVPSDTLGVLQDVHWSSGMMGSFPTYTLGNIMGAQLFRAASADAAVAEGLDRGDYAPLTAWLGTQVHRHGRSRRPAEILLAATGKPLAIDDYVAVLKSKIADLAAG
jgi:carboxypeptidase Taq